MGDRQSGRARRVSQDSSILDFCHHSSLAVDFSTTISSPSLANPRIPLPLYLLPWGFYSSSSIPGSHSKSSNPHRASIYQTDPLNHEPAVSPTTRLTTSSTGDFLDSSTHLDRHSTPINDGGCHPKCGSTGRIERPRKWVG